VYVADNAGNTILSFGQYGNTDSRGGLTGPGQTQAQPAFPLGWPIAVATSEDFIYVNDWINSRLVRVQMTYVLDNMPGLTLHGLTAERKVKLPGLAMTSSPNPFTPLSRVQVSLPADAAVTLAVYDLGGRLIRTLSDSRKVAGVHAFTWRGDDASGRPVSAGIYVYRLIAGKRTLIHKTILAK
jgi:hypothetical protein